MGFVGLYRAIYNYTPASDGELAIAEGDLLFVLEKNTEDDWWRAKKRAAGAQDDEPEGLIPSNYIEEAKPLSRARALYDYSRQTDEELSFGGDASLQIYDTSDPDWTLVGTDGEYGFAPANYIEASSTAATPAMPVRSHVGTIEQESSGFSSPSAASPTQSPATALAGLIQQRTEPVSPATVRSPPATAQPTLIVSDDEIAPSLPRRPTISVPSPPSAPYVLPTSRASSAAVTSPTLATNGGHQDPSEMQMYNIHEMVSHLGRKRKLPMVLGVDLSRGLVMISPEKLKDGPSREWTADKLSNYSIEGKHIFMELIRPSKSVDFHAGNKDTAQQIVSVLGELAGAARAGGLREVIAAGTGSGLKRGQMLYEFMAQGDDEVTVAVGDEVIVLDDTRSEEWWMIRRLKNGTEGVVPSSYVEISGTTNPTPARAASGRSYAEQNRMEEERMAREAARTPRDEVSVEKTSRQTRADSKASGARSKPDSLSVRVWTDRSGTFKVDAEFLGLKDGKIHLHKTNGVKIAVPAAKMSTEDLDYVDRVTGNSIEQEKPLPDTKKLAAQKSRDMSLAQPSAASLRQTSGATLQRSEQSQLDWFEFFLACGCNPQICERYSTTFDKDQMGEENLQDINATLLRTLGLKEGDILRVMKHLDARFGRSKPDFDASESTNGDGGGGLFSGSNGTLKNNTRKGRPAPAVETNDTVNPKVFETSKDNSAPTLLPVKLSQRETSSGFDDDAWDVKPSRLAQRPENRSSTIPTSTAIQRPAGTGAMADLSLLSSSIDYPVAAPAITASSIQSIPALEPQRTGATTSFFNQLPQSSGSQSSAQQNLQRAGPQAVLNQQPKAFPPAQPSARSFSAPLAVSQPSEYTQLAQQPQMTGNHAQMAPSGQSLNEIGQRRYQQQYNQQSGFAYALNGIVPAQTGYQSTLPQSAGLAQFPQSQVMGYPQNMQASYLTGSMTGSPFADPSPRPLQLLQYQQTGYQQQTYLPQPLQPQRTGMNGNMPMPLQPQITGMNGYTNSMTTPSFTSVQSITPQQQHTPAAAPLQPQKTGPAPPIRFGVAPTALPLVSQPTGRRANLAQATPQNPFGF